MLPPDVLVPTTAQANIRIMETVASRLGLPMDKVNLFDVFVVSVCLYCALCCLPLLLLLLLYDFYFQLMPASVEN